VSKNDLGLLRQSFAVMGENAMFLMVWRRGRRTILLVDVTPAPVFARLEGFDDGMIRGMEMLRRVFVL
jgi:hypothetical protein